MYRYKNLNEFDDLEDDLPIRNGARRAHRKKKASIPQYAPKKAPEALWEELAAADEDSGDFIKTYNASRHERVWIADALTHFYHQQWITDILRQVKGGKEASVYLCEGHPNAPLEFMAAKVYRPRHFRNLRNDHLYREGRLELDEAGNEIIDGGMLHAMAKRTTYGQDLLHSSWIAYEMVSMETLHAAGAAIPQPLGRSNNAILMEYIGAPDFPAPILQSVSLPRGEAGTLYRKVVDNIVLMLAHDIIHGDLSAYNILYWDGDVILIDFPQVVAPGQNRSAYQIFQRDVQRVCEYFTAQGVRTDARRLARDLWKQRGLRTGPDVHPGLLDAEDEDDILYWQALQEG